jgi:hypothetical protein
MAALRGYVKRRETVASLRLSRKRQTDTGLAPGARHTICGASSTVDQTMAFARTAFSGFQYGSGAGPYDAASRRAALDRLDLLATVFDTAFILPGTNIRFGVESLLRLVPGVGDVAASLLSFYLLYEASRLGVPRLLMARMAANVVLEGAVGVVPFAGDAFDIFFRANRRNVALLRRHFARKGFV